MSQFTICLEHVSDVTSAVVNASAKKAVPIVSSTPRTISEQKVHGSDPPDRAILRSSTRCLSLSSY